MGVSGLCTFIHHFVVRSKCVCSICSPPRSVECCESVVVCQIKPFFLSIDIVTVPQVPHPGLLK